MVEGYEWADQLATQCGAEARDRATGERFFCKLRYGHTAETHFWQEIRGDQLRSAAWIATGPVTFIGSGVAELEQEANK